jgi:hypothetical protein
VIFIDGSYHDSPQAQAKDRETDDKLIWGLSLEVVRFHHSADWRAICAAHTHLFGTLPRAPSHSG